MWGFIAKLLTGGSKLATTAAAGTAAVAGGDMLFNHGNLTKSALTSVMENLGISQAGAGVETGMFSIFKWLDEIIEAFVGMSGRSPMTDFMRSGLQGMMKIPPEGRELGALNRPDTLSNPKSMGYMGPDYVENAKRLAEDPNAAGVVVGADGKAVVASARVPDTGGGEKPIVTIMDPAGFINNLGQEFAGFQQDLKEGDWGSIRAGLAENGKAALQSVYSTTGWVGGLAWDGVNLIENLTFGWFGKNFIPDDQGMYADKGAKYMTNQFKAVADGYLGGAPDIEHSATAQLFNAAGGFILAAPIRGTQLAVQGTRLALNYGVVSSSEGADIALNGREPALVPGGV